MMKACIIISGGEYCPVPERAKDNYIIACDKGFEYAQQQGIVPNMIIGDFDSCEGNPPQETGSLKVVRYPAEKDDTDTMIALKTALDLGYDDVTVYCGFGGRLDHLYANFQTAVYGAEHGVVCRFVDERNEVFALKNGSVVLEPKEGWSLSVFAVSDVCRGVTIEGARYEISGAELTNTFPLGVSNQWKGTGEDARISVEEGTLLIIMSEM